MSIEKIVFVNTTTEDGKLAIQTCPSYDALVERAVHRTYDEIKVAHLRTNCPQQNYCGVSLIYEPLSNRLRVRGECLM